ncbi:deoxyribonuclease II isoform X2 [Lycorma delicatula]|uniref:deoxyribonuclease II isoform X2 n=1 Tax=Lycorma delicatula TaxID=130591 RepID=UPI003F515F01
MLSIISFYLVLLGIKLINAELSCSDENGNSVDWFFLYKLPDEKGNNDKDNGTNYFYMTSNTVSKEWIISDKLITDANSMPAITLKPLYSNTSDVLWILYNDQPPAGEKINVGSRKGHTKGVVGVDKTGGFWLIHSVPNFPPSANNSNRYSFPNSGLKNGQSFLCISLSASNIDNIGTQLQYNQINVFWKNITKDLSEQYPKLAGAANGTKIKRAPWNNLITLTSVAGNEFYSFAKSAKFKKDLYEDWVALELKTDLFVETWLNGRGRLDSNCSLTYKVKNVDKVQLCQVSQCSAFVSSKDHSKWAVSATKNNPWLCVGDINRAKSQQYRGGEMRHYLF